MMQPCPLHCYRLSLLLARMFTRCRGDEGKEHVVSETLMISIDIQVILVMIALGSPLPVVCADDEEETLACWSVAVSRRGKYFFLMFSTTVAENVPERSQRSTTRFTFSYIVGGGFIVVEPRSTTTMSRVEPIGRSANSMHARQPRIVNGHQNKRARSSRRMGRGGR